MSRSTASMSILSQAEVSVASGDDTVPELQVLVVGEALIDMVEHDGQSIEHVGGSPANVALGVGRRGIAVALLSQLGRDARGRTVIEHLGASGVSVLEESLIAGRTSTARARIAPDGQASYEFDIEWGVVPVPSRVNPRLMHVGSIGAFVEPGAGSVRTLVRDTSAREVTFDPNIRPALVGRHDSAVASYEAMARLATVVKMSDEDAGWLYPGVDVDRVIDAVLELGPSLVAITLGGRGAVIATARHRAEIPAELVDTVDTIGAGDTFMASLIHSVLEHGSRGLDRHDLERIGQDAVYAASITVGRSGADLPWSSELTRPVSTTM